APISSTAASPGLARWTGDWQPELCFLTKLSPPRGFSPWSDDCWPGRQSWLHGDKPRGGRRMLWIGFWPSVIDPPGQARWRFLAMQSIVAPRGQAPWRLSYAMDWFLAISH